jgi:broad specificity phosphatase PhoE
MRDVGDGVVYVDLDPHQGACLRAGGRATARRLAHCVAQSGAAVGHTSRVTAELIFVRHGESNFNRDRRWQGQSQDALLSDLGWRQAECAAEALRDRGLAALFSSDLTRAMQTAVSIAAATGLPISPDKRLREIDAGRWTNRLSDEVSLDEAERVEAWNNAPATTSLPDGEGLAEAQQRILEFVADRIPAYDGHSVIIAIHGAILQTLMAAASGVPLDGLWLETPAANGAIVRVSWSPGPGAGTLRLLGPPSVAHLASLGSAGVTLGSAGGPGPVA